MKSLTKVEEFEALWGAYIAKLVRLDELEAQGRYGYQLRMPKKSLRIAGDRLQAFCAANGLSFPGGRFTPGNAPVCD